MKIIHGSDVDYESRKEKKSGRGGTGHKTQALMNDQILGRDPNRPDNFYLGISTVNEGEFSTPRHHHNFEQWRYMVEGTADFGTGSLETGSLGYFPEGAYYGPQENVVGTVIICQFGGPSGSGYISRGMIVNAHAEMAAQNTGYFEDGLYKRNPGIEGTPVQDAYEAQWEYIRKRPLKYPAPQYPNPIMIDTNAYPWAPLEGAEGVSEKALGTFSSCRTRAAKYKVEPKASFTATGRGVFIALSGSGKVEGEAYKRFTALYLEDGEQGTFTADETTEILLLGLPSMALMHSDEAELQAAE